MRKLRSARRKVYIDLGEFVRLDAARRPVVCLWRIATGVSVRSISVHMYSFFAGCNCCSGGVVPVIASLIDLRRSNGRSSGVRYGTYPLLLCGSVVFRQLKNEKISKVEGLSSSAAAGAEHMLVEEILQNVNGGFVLRVDIVDVRRVDRHVDDHVVEIQDRIVGSVRVPQVFLEAVTVGGEL